MPGSLELTTMIYEGPKGTWEDQKSFGRTNRFQIEVEGPIFLRIELGAPVATFLALFVFYTQKKSSSIFDIFPHLSVFLYIYQIHWLGSPQCLLSS